MDGGSLAGSARRQESLIGRKDALDILWSRYQSSASGHSCMVLLAGEPGIGKTRLLGELAARGVSESATVLRGGSTEAEGMPPYLPFLEALGRYIRSVPPDLLRRQSGAGVGSLAAILPELQDRLGEFPTGYVLPPDQSRLRLFEAVSVFVVAISLERPLILILDDMQWSDSASLDLLTHIIRQQPDSRLLVLGAYRPGEVARNPALERTLTELNRLRVLTTISLGPLSPAEISALTSTRLGGEVEGSVKRLLYERSEGNPFFAEELLRGWSEEGAVVWNGERWELAGSPPTRIPSSVTEAIRQRLLRFPSDVLDLLRTAAIVGRSFETELLAEAAGEEAEDVELRLVDACRAQLLRQDEGGGYTFSHDRIRECLYAEVTPVRRKRLHGFIGRALEQRGGDSARHLDERAFHFARSGDRQRGAQYAVQAAARAMETFAFEEATVHYRTALDLTDDDDPQLGSLQFRLGEAAILAGGEREAVKAFESAYHWFLQTGDSLMAARAAHGLGRAWWRQESLASAREAFQSALHLLTEQFRPETVHVLVDLASLLAVSLGQQSEGVVHARRALEIARALGDERVEAAASRTIGNLLVRGNDIPTGLPLLERALVLAEAADDPAEAAECCSCLALALMWKGELRRCLEIIERRVGHAERSRDIYQLRHAYTWRVGVAMWRGEWNAADRMLDEAQEVAERQASLEPLAFVYNIRGSKAWWEGNYSEAENWFKQSTEIFRQMGPDVLVWYLAPLGLVRLAQGKHREALECMTEVERLIEPLAEGTIQSADPLVHLSLMALMLGDHQRAQRYYSRLLPFQGLHIDFLVDRILGELAILLGDYSAASKHLDAAEVAARREDNKPNLAFTLEAWANLALAQHGRSGEPRARSLLEQARGLFEEFGMIGEATRVAGRLRELRNQSVTIRRSFPAGLSEREVEVLRLVATGRTNREIAEDLVLSEKTVINHLTSIYTKIDVDNRAGATAFAVRQGLA